MKVSKRHGGKLRWEQQTSCPMTAGGSDSPKCLRCSQSMRKPKSMKIVPKCPERSVETCWVSFFLILPAFCTKLFSYFSFSGCFEFSTSAKFTPFTQWVQMGPAYLQNYRRPAFHGFQICWGAGQHPQNHLPSVHAVRTPQVSKCLQDAPTIYAARPRKTCRCDQDNEHTLLQPFWRQLQAWQEPNQSCSLTASIASSSIYWKLLKHTSITISCNFESMSMTTAPKRNGSTVKHTGKSFKVETQSNTQRMHSDKSKQVHNRQLQDIPRCSKRTSCQPRHAKKDNLRWPGSRCIPSLHRTWI